MILRLLGAVAACLVAAFAILVWQLSRGPLSLAFAIPYLEAEVRGQHDEWQLRIADLVLMHDLQIHARDVDLLGEDGAALLRVPDVILRPSLRAIAQGTVGLSSIEITGAQASVERRADGSFGVSVAQSAPPEPADGEGQVEFLQDLLEPAGDDTFIGFLTHFQVTDANLSIEDVETGAGWTVENADIELTRGETEHLLTVEAKLPGGGPDTGHADLTARLAVRPQGEGFLLEGETRTARIDVARLGLYWPQNAVAAARRWVTQNIPHGHVNEAVLYVSLASASGMDFELGRLDGTMRYEGLEVRWDEDVPPVVGVGGTATFDRSSMRFQISRGATSGIRVHSGDVRLLDLDTDNERIGIVVKGRGPLADAVGLAPGAREEIPFEMKGDADLDAHVAFPLHAKLKFSDVDLRVDADPEAVELRHDAATATVSGRVQYGKKAKRDAVLRVDLDLSAAHVDSGRLNWTLPSGKKGKLEFDLTLKDGPLQFEETQLRGPGIRASGAVTIAGQGGAARLRNVVFGKTDVDRFEVEWRPTAVRARLGDGTLDLEPFMNGAADDPADDTGDRAPIDLDVETGLLHRVSFDQDSWLENLRSKFIRRDGIWERIDIRGDLPKALWTTGNGSGTKSFSVQLEPTGPGWRMQATAPDFGSLLSATDVSTEVRGGVLEVRGRADRTDTGGVLRSHVKVTNFTVKDAPVFVRILTVAALDRFVSTLRGSGLHFDSVKGTVVARDGRYDLQNFRAHGSSLGWTANGWIDAESERLSLNGALIPAYTANRVLRRIPVLGSLLMGSDNKGLIAISYAASGDLNSPRVTTNPLTALTPGFLREVWDLGPRE